MKKVLAFILSLVLAFTLVAVVACNTQPGGGTFKEVDLNDKSTREEFVNTLAEKIDVEKLLGGDPTKEGWTYGLEEKASSKVEFDLSATFAQAAAEAEAKDDKLTAKGNIELSENAKVTYKSNGLSKAPEFAASVSLTAKGKIDLNDNLYALIGSLGEEEFGEDFDLAAAVKKLIGSNFNYKVDAYVDSEAALISLSDDLYKNLPEFVTEMLGSKNIKVPFGPSASVLASEAEGNGLELDKEQVKAAINNVIDEYILPFKVSVSVANKNGYALKLTVTKDSVVAVLNTAFSGTQTPEWVELVKNSIDSGAKLELTVRVDSNGALSSVELESNIKLNLDLTLEGVNVKGTVSLSGSVELKKFSGKVSKPSGEFKEIQGFEGSDPDIDWDEVE